VLTNHYVGHAATWAKIFKGEFPIQGGDSMATKKAAKKAAKKKKR
jgi:hypothetical protein